MNIYLTFDYELFFGPETGTVEKCMIEPTERLIELAGKEVKLIFFVDVGFLVAMERFSAQYPELGRVINKVRFQVKRLVDLGHDVQLHIHPHWESAEYSGGKWVINASGSYRLDDFSDEYAGRIFREYKSYLDELTGRPSTAFRAGGWCIQPFNKFRDLFIETGIRVDSSVMPGVKYESEHYRFDFTDLNRQSAYRFDKDVLVEEKDGMFTEFPISTWYYPPTFYWNLYVRGRLAPGRHKMIGDGQFIPQPGRKKKGLSSGSLNHISCDGYYATMLMKAYREFKQKGEKDLVIIGHPKGMTEYSFHKLGEFIKRVSKEETFNIFGELK